MPSDFRAADDGIVLSWASARYCDAVDALNRAGIGESDEDALALFHAVWPGTDPFTAPPEPGSAAAEAFAALLERRCAGAPLAHLTGTVRFRGMDLAVEPGVFIPRERTTLDLAEAAVAASADVADIARPVRIADVGTGTGVLALVLARSLGERARITATDRSPAAIALAARNAARLGCEISLVCTDLLGGVAGPFDLVVANPPYLVRPESNARWHELRAEPPEAIDGGGDDGLGVARRLLAAAAAVLDPAGVLMLELATSQMHRAAQAAAVHFREVAVVRNAAGVPRVLVARKPLGGTP